VGSRLGKVPGDMARNVLLTGFEPYGGRGLNPAHEAMKALDGHTIEGATIVGRGLPVSLAEVRQRLPALIEDVEPLAVISLGLWPGESAIRLERIGINVVDYEIRDNDGLLITDGAVNSNAAAARLATLPLRAIESALLEQGTPVRISSTAGTFLCNACLFTVLDILANRARHVPAGFIHIPYIPEQVATMIKETRTEAALEIHQRADVASMELSRIVAAVDTAIAVTLRELGNH
jgi:pyroglutamyl-peptidase